MTTNTIQKYCLNEIKNVSTDIPLDNMEQMYREKRGKVGRTVRVKQDIHKSGAKSEPEDIPISELYKRAQNPLKSHYHEVLDRSTSTYLDQDIFEYVDGPILDRKKLISETISIVEQVLACSRREFLMFDSSGEYKDIRDDRQTRYKHSFRIIFHDCYWYSARDQLEKIKLIKELVEGVDIQCYNKCPSMRIPYSTKMGQTRILQKIDLLKDGFPLIPIEKITLEEFNTFFIQTDIPVSQDGRFCGAPPRDDDKVGVAHIQASMEDPFIQEILQQANQVCKTTLSVLSIKPLGNGKYGMIELRHYHEQCPLCEDYHHGNRNYIIFNPKAKTAALKCHGTKGKGKRIMLKESPLMGMALNGGEYTLAQMFADAHKEDVKIMEDGYSYIWNEAKRLWLKGKDIHVQNMISPFFMTIFDNLIDNQTDPKIILQLRKQRVIIERTSTAKAILSPLKSMLIGNTNWEKQLNMASKLFPAANGTIVELDTGISRPRTRQDMFTFERPVRLIEPHLRNPVDIKRFLGGLFGEDAVEIHKYMRKQLGLCLTGETARQFFIWIGEDASNGKSTLCEIMEAVLGRDEFFKAISKYVFVKAKGSRNSANEHKSHLDPLSTGVRMAAAHESSQDDELDGYQIKNLSSSDSISVRGLYEKEKTFQNHACLIMSTNHKVALQIQDQGIMDRFSPVIFNYRFVDSPDPNKPNERKRDEGFIKYMKTDLESLSQTFTFLVEGAVLYFKEGLQSPEVMTKAKRELVKEQDYVASFIEDVCVIDQKNPIGVWSQTLVDRYNEWRGLNTDKDKSAMDDNSFYNSFKKHTGLKPVKKSGMMLYQGVIFRKFEDQSEAQKAHDLLGLY